jgi:prolyl-tRNA synthetase
MRWSRAFLPTLRDAPQGAEAASHKLLVRGGFIRQVAAGVYAYLPLGRRVLRKVEAIAREEMDAIGGLEFHMPALHPAEAWKKSGRWDAIGEDMFRLRDRKQAELCLGMTAEELFTQIAADALRSYRQLPQIWYQIQTKFRDEARPKSGLMRCREFLMKDSYSFDLDEVGLDRSFQLHVKAYERIFHRCGLEAFRAEAFSGAMGGSESAEFIALSEAGEDWIATCPGCGYAANVEKARSEPPAAADPEQVPAVEPFPTPGVRTIEQLVRFPGGAPAYRQIKTLVYKAGDELVLLCLRGDDELCEAKAQGVTGVGEIRPAHDEEIRARLGAHAGSLGPVGVTGLPVFVDLALEGRRGLVTGANRDGFHHRHVDLARDVPGARYVDLRTVRAGEPCARCGKPLEVRKGIEVGHIFKLGLCYSEPMGASALGPDGREQKLLMGCYGMGLSRVMSAVAEARHDEHGLRWPLAIAPYQVVVTPIQTDDAAQMGAAEELYRGCLAAGLEVVLDDRDDRAGVKFKDADLIGFPFRLVPGARALARGQVELAVRASGEKTEIPLDSAVAELGRRIAGHG